MTKDEALEKIQSARAGNNVFGKPVSGDALDAGWNWIETTFDVIAPTSIVANPREASLDFQYGAEPKWLTLTIRGANDSESTGLGVPGTYDGPLLNKANPTIEEIKEFFAD